jgi:hypothetical protein
MVGCFSSGLLSADDCCFVCSHMSFGGLMASTKKVDKVRAFFAPVKTRSIEPVQCVLLIILLAAQSRETKVCQAGEAKRATAGRNASGGTSAGCSTSSQGGFDWCAHSLACTLSKSVPFSKSSPSAQENKRSTAPMICRPRSTESPHGRRYVDSRIRLRLFPFR